MFKATFHKRAIYKTTTFAIITIFSLIFTVFTVFAGSTSLDMDFDGTEPTAVLPENCAGSFPITLNYHVVLFNVDVTGNYNIDIVVGTLPDSVLLIYTPSFDAGNPTNNCIASDFNTSGGAGLTTNLNANTTYFAIISPWNTATIGTYTLNFSGPGNICTPTCTEPAREDANGMPLPAFYDSRINDYDTAAPIAIFPHQVDGETGLIIYNTDGVEMLLVSPQQIADAPDNPDTNTLIATANGVSLYRLAGGNWQINAPQYNGKTYVMIFPELFHSGGYESFELEP